MGIIAIARIIKDEYISNKVTIEKTIGFRLLDNSTGEVKDAEINSIIDVLEKGITKINNLKIKDNGVVGYNGSIMNYTTLKKGVVSNKNKLMIVNRIGGQGYTVTNYTGNMTEVSRDEAIQLVYGHEIINGKVRETGSRRDIIPYEGEYENAIKNTEEEVRISKINIKLKALGSPYQFISRNIIDITNTNIEELNIIEGVEYILKPNDYYLRNLKYVRLPSTLCRVTKELFKMSALTNIDITKGVKVIGDSAFYGCSNMESIVIPDGIETIESCAFAACKRLKKVRLSDNIKDLGDSVFWNCSMLKDINIPTGISKIYKHTFSFCKSLNTVVIPRNIKEIQDFAFGYSIINTLIIESEDTVIQKLAFEECEIKKLIKPSTMT